MDKYYYINIFVIFYNILFFTLLITQIQYTYRNRATLKKYVYDYRNRNLSFLLNNSKYILKLIFPS